MGLRCFIAIELPGEIQESIHNALSPMAQTSEIKWVRPGNIHLTLKFLGNIVEDRVHDITKGIERALDGCAPITIRARGAGAFPSTRRPSVLWVGIEAPGTLMELQGRLNDEMASLGFGTDEKAFHPHLTVGRVRKGQRVPGDTMAGFKSLVNKDFGFFEADSIKLMQSELRPEGPKYSVLHSVTPGQAKG